MRLKFLCSLGLVSVLMTSAACSPTMASRGATIDPDTLAEIKVGTTREDVAAKLGTPTIVSAFDDKIWYYVGRKTEQYSFFDPEVVEQNAVEVRFDDQGQVVFISRLDLSDAHDVEALDQRTPTYGNDHTFIQQLLGNLSHPVPKTSNNRGGQ